MSLRGIRGATVAVENSEDAILDATRELIQALVDDNDLVESDIASIFFSVTPDLDQAFPAKAARQIGFDITPLMCFSEIPVPSDLDRCIRIMVHVNTEKLQSDMKNVYLRGAVALRPDKYLNA